MEAAILASGLDITSRTFVVDGVRNMRPEYWKCQAAGGNYGEVTIPNAHLFALWQVKHPTITLPQGDLMIGYRNSVAQTMARRACVGVSFPICTNVSLFGDDIVFSKKNTCGQRDFDLIALRGVQDKVLPMFETIQDQLDRLQSKTWGGAERRSATLALFEQGVLPTRYITPLRDLWEDARLGGHKYPEVEENWGNELGLMHSCTRVIQAEKGIRRQAKASQAVSRFFQFGVAAA
jgi:hypothetical protein